MNDTQPYRVELPADGPSGDLWRVEFRVDGQLIWLDNFPEQGARFVYSSWLDALAGRLQVCNTCPEGPGLCPHKERPEQVGWAYTDMTTMRIMPMREAV